MLPVWVMYSHPMLMLKMAELSDTLQTVGFQSKKFKGGISFGGHLTVTYGGKLLNLRTFS